MPYAQLSSVKGRAGRFASAWSATTTPGDADIEQFLAQTAGLVDALIAARGIATPATGTAAAALESVNADGALLLALAGTPLGDAGAELMKVVQARYDAEMARLGDGTHPALVLLATQNPQASGASSFWKDEPQYGTWATAPERLVTPEGQWPSAERGMKL